jgi:tRNA 2-selenouridine synthase
VPVSAITAAQALAQIDAFDTIIDARSPAEYAEDRLPGAVNWPSLDDAQRAEVGTLHQQQSAFEARKRGAALVARNIAGHLDRELAGKAKDWSPLVYCWRGGKRSGSLALVLDQIGFRVRVLEGGYREYRRAVVAALETLPAAFEFRVVCGTTGSGKSRLLQALAGRGAQVLDLEELANHRGSVLGLVPGTRQPSQKAFDSTIWNALRLLDPGQPVFVESESKKIGDLRVPEALILRMRASPCLWLELGLEQRVVLLMEDYAFFVSDPEALCLRLDALRELRGAAFVERCQAAARGGGAQPVVRDLLVVHYDPVYLQSMRRNFAHAGPQARRIEWDGSASGLQAAARQILGQPAPAA